LPKKSTTGLASFRDKLTSAYGEGRVTRQEKAKPYEVVSTGSLSLDYALRVGGWVRGRMHEIVGPPGVGKSTLVLNSMAQHQLKYPKLAVAYIDMEQTFDRNWAVANGLDVSDDRFLHVFPDNAEQVSDLLRAICREAPISCVVVDSIGGMESKSALEKDAEDSVVGRSAQVITRMVKHVATLTRESGATCLLVNQYRANLNYGASDISAGPRALAYATTTKVALRRTGTRPKVVKVNGEDEEISREIRAKVERNKVAAQGRVGTFWITNQIAKGFPELGIDKIDEAWTIGLQTGVIRQSGAFYTLPGADKAIQGGDKAKEALRADLVMVAKLREQALALVAGEVVPETSVTVEEES
jgi:recombination protein RecA